MNVMHADHRRAAPAAAGAPPLAGSRHRLVIPGLQLAHLACFAAMLDAGFDPVALTASGLASVVLYAWFVLAEYRWNGYRPTPILFYLVAGVFRLGAGVLFVVAAMAAGYWRFVTAGRDDVSGFLMHGHWLALVGDWCFVAGYFAVASRFRPRPHAPARVSPDQWRRAWCAGLVTAAMTVGLRFAGENIGVSGFGQLVSYVTDYGVAVGVYLMLLAARNGVGRQRTLWAGAALVFLGLDIADGFYSYMKSNLFIALLPLVLVAADGTPAGPWAPRRRRLVPAVAVSALVVYFFLFVVSAYSSPRRAALWQSGVYTDPAVRYAVPVAPYLTDAVLAAVPGTAAFQDAHRFPNGVWQIIGRMSLTSYPAWAYRRVEATGTRDGSFFEDLLVSVTPRIVWPDKPPVSFGRDFAVAIGDASSFDSATSAVALTLQGAYYWWGGYFALVLGCGLTGAGFALVWLLFRDQCPLNPASALAGLVLYHEGFRWFESAVLGGFPLYLYLIIVFAPLQFAVRRGLGYRAPAPAPARFRRRPA